MQFAKKNSALEKILFESPEATFQWGLDFGRKLSLGSILLLQGELGAGKTTLTKAIVHGALGIDTDEVTSPTFAYLNIYSTPTKVFYHFDLYRIKSEDDFLSLGFDEYFQAGGICCFEWPERIASLILRSERINPEIQQIFKISLSHRGETKRLISLEGFYG
jgi:tRNA threonylcarbamoyladenosine biosynthesis protein TsaE